MWKKLKQKGIPPKGRSFHGACAIDCGRSILISGGMVDCKLQQAVAFGLGFDAELYLLELVPLAKQDQLIFGPTAQKVSGPPLKKI